MNSAAVGTFISMISMKEIVTRACTMKRCRPIAVAQHNRGSRLSGGTVVKTLAGRTIRSDRDARNSTEFEGSVC
jgi:hypothetical protein